jgi:hypothetical protein
MMKLYTEIMEIARIIQVLTPRETLSPEECHIAYLQGVSIHYPKDRG